MKKELYNQPEMEVLLLSLEQCIAYSNLENPEEDPQPGLFTIALIDQLS